MQFPVTFEPLPAPEHVDLMPLDEFAALCNMGAFIDYDGTGYYATETEESNVLAKPSYVCDPNTTHPEWATHVAWYNK